MFSGRQAGVRLPDGVTVATYRNYETAQQAINSLAEADIDISGMALVGSEVRVVERVMGKLTWRKVAMAGAMRGLTFGLFLGIVFWLLVPEAGIAILAMPVLGIAFGMLLSIVTHTFTRKNRQYQSVQQLIPASFDLIAPREVAAAAMHKLGPQVRRPEDQNPGGEQNTTGAGQPAPESSETPTQAEPPAQQDRDTRPEPSAAPGPASAPSPPDEDRRPEPVPNPLAGRPHSRD